MRDAETRFSIDLFFCVSFSVFLIGNAQGAIRYNVRTLKHGV